jgi:hypothetical protein
VVNGPDRYARSPWLVCKTWFLTCQHIAGLHRILLAPLRPGPSMYSTCRISTFVRIVCDNFFFWERFQVGTFSFIVFSWDIFLYSVGYRRLTILGSMAPMSSSTCDHRMSLSVRLGIQLGFVCRCAGGRSDGPWQSSESKTAGQYVDFREQEWCGESRKPRT